MRNLSLSTDAGVLLRSFNLPSGHVSAVTVKDGPFIARVVPAAGVITPLGVASGMFVSIYRAALAAATAQTDPLPSFPRLRLDWRL